MTRLKLAQERLDRALSRLEKAVSERGGAESGDRGLAAELVAIQERYARLEGRTRGVCDRLDTTIARVKSIMKD